MAKKPKSAEGEEGAADGAAEGGGKSKKKLIMFGIIGLVVLGGGGGGGWYFLKKGKSAEAEKPVKKPVAFLDVKEMIVNLAPEPNQERTRFLKIKVALEVGDPKTMTEITPLLPRVEDTFQVYVRELRPSDLDGSAGTYRLREELLRRVNIAVYPAKVDAVLFKEVVLQ